MLRGFRWQLIVFVTALVLFGISLISHNSPGATPPESSPTLLPSPVVPENTPLPVPTDLPAAANAGTPIITYREALVGTVQRLNPLLADLNPVDRDITSLIFEGLTRIDQYGEAVPD